MNKVTQTRVKLSNGVEMPKFGIGTYKMGSEDVLEAVPAAIRLGYRLIDTATFYKNEEAVGRAIATGAVARKDLFVESKLATVDQGYDSALRAVQLSLDKLGLDYIDLYVVHWPGASGLDPSDPKNAELRRGSWRALEELYEAGKCRSIGVSNYLARHLEEMRQYARIMPMVNQFELHPGCVPEETIRWCLDNNVVIQAYASLARGQFLDKDRLSRHPILERAAAKHGKTVSQVLLRWAWQRGYCVIPKSVTGSRIAENADIDFDLSDGEMAELDSIHTADPFRTCWDPSSVA